LLGSIAATVTPNLPAFCLDFAARRAADIAAYAVSQSHQGGEANLILPDLDRRHLFWRHQRSQFAAVWHRRLHARPAFGLAIYMNLKKLPVHRAMREISELIYETCKTYLITQGKFILILEAFIAASSLLYFGVLSRMEPFRVAIILLFSLVGIAGSYGVAWFGIRVNTFANSRTAFASLEGKPFPLYAIPLKAGMSIGMMLISVELLIMLCILLFIPGDYAGTVLHRFRDR
jgi:K(+)-stimulated pyrophosphate-energized sodium pump